MSDRAGSALRSISVPKAFRPRGSGAWSSASTAASEGPSSEEEGQAPLGFGGSVSSDRRPTMATPPPTTHESPNIESGTPPARILETQAETLQSRTHICQITPVSPDSDEIRPTSVDFGPRSQDSADVGQFRSESVIIARNGPNLRGFWRNLGGLRPSLGPFRPPSMMSGLPIRACPAGARKFLRHVCVIWVEGDLRRQLLRSHRRPAAASSPGPDQCPSAATIATT